MMDKGITLEMCVDVRDKLLEITSLVRISYILHIPIHRINYNDGENIIYLPR